MNRNSPVPLWAVLGIGVVLVSAVYVVAQRAAVQPQASVIAQQISGLPSATAERMVTVTTSIVPSPSIVPTPSVTASSISESAGWKTYRNNQFGFQISYPQTFLLKESTYPLRDEDVKSENAAYFYNLDLLNATSTIHYFGLAVAKSRFSLSDYEKTKVDDTGTTWSIVRRSLDNISGYDTFGPGWEGHIYVDYFDFVKGGLLYTVFLDPVFQKRVSVADYESSGGCCNDYDSAKDRSTYEKILSSFQILP